MALNGTCKHFDWYPRDNRGPRRVVCGCKARHFFKVTFDPDTLPHSRALKTEIVFGFCNDHAVKYTTIDGWKAKNRKNQPSWFGKGYSVNGQHGVVVAVSNLQLSKADFERERARDALITFKSQFWRIIHQDNAARITPEMWKSMFEELYLELAVEDTMKG